MSDIIMRAIKTPNGTIANAYYGITEKGVWRFHAEMLNVERFSDEWVQNMKDKGYRCIRVRVTEVQDE
jgi:hypothetical protein